MNILKQYADEDLLAYGIEMNYISEDDQDLALELLEEILEEEKLFYDYIASEQDLSDRFDQLVTDLSIDTDDKIAIVEAFNNWSDGLCKDGEIHDLQYNNYGYIGKYS